MRQKKTILLIGLLSLLLLQFLLLSYLQNPLHPEIPLEKIRQREIIYDLRSAIPLSDYANYVVVYPYIRIPPNDKKYPLVHLLEEYNIYTKKYDYLFFSSKRIAELSEWSQDMPIDFSLKNPSDLKNKKYLLLTNVSWESILADYFQLLENHLKVINSDENARSRINRLYLLYLHIEEDAKTLISLVNRSPFNQKTKDYLLDNIFFIQNHFLARIAGNIEYYDPFIFVYPLQQIHKDKEWGSYELYLNSAVKLPQVLYSDLKIKTDADSFQFFAFLNNFNQPDANLEIDKTKNNLILELPKINIQEKKEWILKKNNQTDTNTFILDLPRFQSPAEYLYLKINSNLSEPFALRLEKEKADKPIFGYSYDEKMPVRPKDKLIQTGINRTNLKFILETKQKISAAQLSELINIELFPLVQPDLIVRKIRSLPGQDIIVNQSTNKTGFAWNIKNSTAIADKFIRNAINLFWYVTVKDKNVNEYSLSGKYWPLAVVRLSLLSTLLATVTVFMLNVSRGARNFLEKVIKLRNKPVENLKEISVRTTNLAKKILTRLIHKSYLLVFRFRLILLIIFFVIFLFDITQTNTFSNVSTLISVILLLSVSLAFKLTPTSFLTLSLISLTAFIALLAMNLTAIAEKLATWTFIYFVIGTVLSLLFIKMNRVIAKSSFQSLMENVALLILRIGEYLLILLLNYLIDLKKFAVYLIKYIYKNPKTLGGHLISLLKLTAVAFSLVLIVTIFIRILIFVNHQYQLHRLAIKRESLNPVISKVEPGLVYKSNKVVIKGSNFGWRGADKVELNSQYGKITTDQWSNERIIFSVPLEWKNGEIKLWIEKRESWQNKSILAKSKVQTIRLIPIGKWSALDDKYFEQLKSLDQDTLELNGYKWPY